MKGDAALLRVFLDPVGWADPAWLAHFRIDARWPRRLGNSLLLQRAGASPMTRADLALPGAGWLLENWDALPVLAYLAGARLARNTLLAGNALLRLRHGAQRFIALPMAETSRPRADETPISIDEPHGDVHDRVLAAGAHCLCSAWPALTPGWRDRLRLRLPPLEVDESAELQWARPPGAGALHLLNHALNFHYAQNY
ncbi:hypothetical protein [Achromobacter xylosoxidans]|uniref:hypothetical protein n=1 Tax=Alcaligenes xylosoxydans xylosoxydans TaxID=85698 RepID=UPI0012DD00C3|nr:hypothetical protein [Achromobacter xylosoxidans]